MSAPTHANPDGQVHVPRVWEITGKAPVDRRQSVREWKETYRQFQDVQHSKSAKRRLRHQTRTA